MSHVTQDRQLIEKVKSAMEPLQLFDEQGALLGRLIPERNPHYRWEPQISEEEIQRREASTEVLTTAQVKKHLEWMS